MAQMSLTKAISLILLIWSALTATHVQPTVAAQTTEYHEEIFRIKNDTLQIADDTIYDAAFNITVTIYLNHTTGTLKIIINELTKELTEANSTYTKQLISGRFYFALMSTGESSGRYWYNKTIAKASGGIVAGNTFLSTLLGFGLMNCFLVFAKKRQKKSL